MKRLFYIIFILTAVTSCQRNRPYRNKIVFQDNIEHIQDSILKMTKILNKLPKRHDDLNIKYEVRNNQIFVNNELFDSIFVKQNNVHSTYYENQAFTSLAHYLNKNYLSSAYFDEFTKLWRFIYRSFPELRFDDARDIVLIDSTKAILNTQNDTVIDHKGKIYLLAPKDAKIQ